MNFTLNILIYIKFKGKIDLFFLIFVELFILVFLDHMCTSMAIRVVRIVSFLRRRFLTRTKHNEFINPIDY